MKLSVQTGGVVDRLGIEKGYAVIREAGFEGIDWNLDHLLPGEWIYAGDFRKSVFEKSVEEILEYLEPELAQIRKNGLVIVQAHAPFPAHSVKHPEIFDYIPMVYEKCIRICEAVGCKILVIHGICHQKRDYVDTADEIEAMNRKLFTGLIPLLKETSVTVCMENLFSGSADGRGAGWTEGHCANPVQAVRFIDELNALAGKACFGLCLDTGHLNLLSGDPRVYIPTLGKRIKALHIHDNNGMYDQHIAPYNGNIIWKQYYGALRDIGYSGDLSFETFNQICFVDEEELIPSQLRAISAVGELFRKRIQEK